MRELKFIQACPNDNYYIWQVHLWLESLKEINQSQNAISLIFAPKGRAYNNNWDKLIELYPESEFKFYNDDDDVSKYLSLYIPILRPYVLWRYFKDEPSSVNKAFFYCDSDILFTKDFNIQHLLEDDVCYLSNTNSYINAAYFDSKINKVLPDKLEEYKKRDILAEITSLIGISREVAEKNMQHSGGAQYLLKNINSAFWKKVLNDTLIIRTYLQNVNKEFFKNENEGFQSWCADMWAVLWNLWFANIETKVVNELDFAWSTDNINKLETSTILHNAGITGPYMNDVPYFYKGNYHLGKTDPTTDGHLDIVLNNEQTKTKCNWYYANKLKELKNKYNLKY